MGYALSLGLVENGLVSGTVQACEGDALLVRGKTGLIRAERAEGCLLAPGPGDRVLVALLDSGEAWVLSVLRRRGGEAALRLPDRLSSLLFHFGEQGQSLVLGSLHYLAFARSLVVYSAQMQHAVYYYAVQLVVILLAEHFRI